MSSVYQENQGKPAPEGQTILDSNEPRDDRVAVAYANRLNLFLTDTSSLSFYRPDALCSLQCFDAVGWAAGRASGL